MYIHIYIYIYTYTFIYVPIYIYVHSCRDDRLGHVFACVSVYLGVCVCVHIYKMHSDLFCTANAPTNESCHIFKTESCHTLDTVCESVREGIKGSFESTQGSLAQQILSQTNHVTHCNTLQHTATHCITL